MRGNWAIAIVAMTAAASVQGAWQEAQSKHFVVYANDRPENVKAFTAKLERFDRAMKVMRGVREDNRGPSARVTVFQLDNQADIQRLYGRGGRGVGGFYQPRATGSVAFVPRQSGGNGAPWELSADRVLLHEYAHHFMYSDWPSAIFPRWYSEGFAEYNSTAIFNRDGSVMFGAAPTDRAWGVNDMSAMPLSKMLNPALGKLDGRETYALYSRGWALTHYLTNTAALRKQLADYIGAVNEGKPYAEAVKPFGNVNALDFQLSSYVKSPRFQSQVVPANKLEIGAVTVRTLSPGEAAVMPARIRSQRGVDERLAKEVVVLARSEAAPFPNDAGAQNALAEAEYDAKDYTAAAAAADRAIAAEPKSLHALVYKGMALQALAEQDKTTDPKRWQEVRKWYLAANRVDTEDPWPLIQFYQSFKPAGQAPSKGAERGLLYAMALAPYDLSLRVTAARIYLSEDKRAEAKTALMMVAYQPHGGEDATKMRDVLAMLDGGDSKGALEKLDKAVADAAAKAKSKNSKRDGDDD